MWNWRGNFCKRDEPARNSFGSCVWKFCLLCYVPPTLIIFFKSNYFYFGHVTGVWKFILAFEGDPPVVKRPIPELVQLELVRFMCAVPLAQVNLRAAFRGDVTTSDASEWG